MDNNIVKLFKDLEINLMNKKGEFKSFKNVLCELSTVWDKI